MKRLSEQADIHVTQSPSVVLSSAKIHQIHQHEGGDDQSRSREQHIANRRSPFGAARFDCCLNYASIFLVRHRSSCRRLKPRLPGAGARLQNSIRSHRCTRYFPGPVSYRACLPGRPFGFRPSVRTRYAAAVPEPASDGPDLACSDLTSEPLLSDLLSVNPRSGNAFR